MLSGVKVFVVLVTELVSYLPKMSVTVAVCTDIPPFHTFTIGVTEFMFISVQTCPDSHCIYCWTALTVFWVFVPATELSVAVAVCMFDPDIDNESE